MKHPVKQNAVITQIQQEIDQGKFDDGERMPTESEYSSRFHVSRQTVRKALSALEQQGMIIRRQGSGSYVNRAQRRKPATGQIAVICTSITEYIFPSILRGVEGVTAKQGYRLLIHSTNNSVASERTILSRLLEDPVDGIIVEGTKTSLPNPNREFYRRLAQKGIPIVFINSYYPDISGQNVISLVTDDHAGGYQAVQEMVQAGHRRICGIFKSDDMQGMLRYSGYMDALVRLGGDVRDNNVIWFSTETRDLLQQHIGAFLQGIDPDCTGVVCYNDTIAVPVIRYFERARVYPVTTIASFDRCLPLLSDTLDIRTFSHPKEAMGIAAAEKLFHMIAGRQESSLTFDWE